jgi:hypothetical protein
MIQDFKQYSYVILDTAATVETKSGGMVSRKTTTKPKYESVQDIEDELNLNGQAGYAYCATIDRAEKTLIILQSETVEHGVPVEYLTSLINSLIDTKTETSRAYYSTVRTQEATAYINALLDLAKEIGLEGVSAHEQVR